MAEGVPDTPREEASVEKEGGPLMLSAEEQRSLIPSLMVGLIRDTEDEVLDRITEPKDVEQTKRARETFIRVARNVGMEIDPQSALRLGLPQLLTPEQLSDFSSTDGPFKLHAQYYRMKQENEGKE